MNDRDTGTVSTLKSLTLRSALFIGISAAIVYALTLITLNTIYFTIPVLVPFLPYLVDPHSGTRQIASNPTVVAVAEVAYVVGTAALAAFWSRTRSLPAAIAVYVATVLGLAGVVHLLFWLVGIPFFIETP